MDNNSKDRGHTAKSQNVPINSIAVNTPYEVGDLVVYLATLELAYVIDYDCRYELVTTPTTCDCCTFRFRSRRDANFQCRHIIAMRSVLKID